MQGISASSYGLLIVYKMQNLRGLGMSGGKVSVLSFSILTTEESLPALFVDVFYNSYVSGVIYS